MRHTQHIVSKSERYPSSYEADRQTAARISAEQDDLQDPSVLLDVSSEDVREKNENPDALGVVSQGVEGTATAPS